MGQPQVVLPDDNSKDAGRPRIIFSGKGGSGKTTVSSAFAFLLLEREETPRQVLLVDADPAMTTAVVSRLVADIVPEKSIGELGSQLSDREFLEGHAKGKYKDKTDFVIKKLRAGALGSKQYTNAAGVTHTVHFIRIGQHHNNQCMCGFNHVLNSVLRVLLTSNMYDYVIIDREAGQEQINRSVYGRPQDIVVAVATPTAPYFSVASEIIRTHQEVQRNAQGEVKARDMLIVNQHAPMSADRLNALLQRLFQQYDQLAGVPYTVFPYLEDAVIQMEPLTREQLLTEEAKQALLPIYNTFKTLRQQAQGDAA